MYFPIGFFPLCHNKREIVFSPFYSLPPPFVWQDNVFQSYFNH